MLIVPVVMCFEICFLMHDITTATEKNKEMVIPPFLTTTLTAAQESMGIRHGGCRGGRGGGVHGGQWECGGVCVEVGRGVGREW